MASSSAAQDRDSLVEDAITARLLTHAQLVGLCQVIAYPDSLETLGEAQRRGIVLVRAYQDATSAEVTQGGRLDKVREVSTLSIELRFLMAARRGQGSVGAAREYCKDALAGYQVNLIHPKYTPIKTIRHVRGGLIGRVKGSKRWDYYDNYELDLIYQTIPGDYNHV